MGYIESYFFSTVAENKLDAESGTVIRDLIKQKTNFSVSSIEEGYRLHENGIWRVLVKLENENYFITEILQADKLVGAPQIIASWPQSSSYLESLTTFIALLSKDEHLWIKPILDSLSSLGFTTDVADINKTLQRRVSYRELILKLGDPRAAQVMRALQDMADKLPTPED